MTRREASAGTGPDMVTTYDYNDSELTGCDLPDTTERFWGHGLVTADALRSDSSVARREQTIFWQTEKVVRGKSTQSMVLAPDDGGGLRLAAQTIREWWGYEGWPRLGAQIEYNCGGGVCQNKRTEYIHDPLMQGGTQYGNLTGIMEYDEDGVLYRQTRRYYNVSDEPGASPPDTTAYMVDRVQCSKSTSGEQTVRISTICHPSPGTTMTAMT
ncbi:MAG: hypothetical protein GWN58_43010 [Anaerolineae bacterium]|nr:hypothetical protein [Anaerolineae bacterium]